MKRRRLLWQLYPTYLLITLLSLLAVTSYSARQLYQFYLQETVDNLRARARLIEPEMLHLITEFPVDSLRTVVTTLGERSETRITIVRPDGLVLADSERDPVEMDNHAKRPEILPVIEESRVGRSSRFSATMQEDMMYVAVPMDDRDGELLAVIRTSKSLRSVNDAIQVLLMSIGVASLSVAVLAAILSWVTARRITAPLERMKHYARRIAAGDMRKRLPEEGNEEVATLAETINLMLIQLDDRIHIIERQRSEQNAVFSSISDGVLAVDADGLLLSINKAAARMFDLKRSKVRGRTVREVINNNTLREFIYAALETHEEVEDEILLGEIDPHYIQAHGRPLRNEEGEAMGAVVVLNNVTRLRRLEKARRDFVANVSHELRTPVTSILGYVETLQEGASEDPEALQRFLHIIQRQSNRLEAIIEDLLSLARIERDTEAEGIQLDQTALSEVISAAITSTAQQAQSKDIQIEVEAPGGVRATINAPLLEQAIVNLLGNAIKYSDAGTTVRVKVVDKKKSVRIRVSDEGVGIEQEHLPRLFERFYRIDKGRSRMEGGTGLGLAIVKHIALAHGGKVTVESEPGVGTTFEINLPKLTGPVQQLSLLDAV